MQETQVPSLGQEDPLEKGMATHSNILGWAIPWTEEPGRLESMGSQRVGHDYETKHSTHIEHNTLGSYVRFFDFRKTKFICLSLYFPS